MIQSAARPAVPLYLGIIAAATSMSGWAQQPSEASPAAQAVPTTTTPQTYAPELIEAGRIRFAAECGFCHGRDAAGGTGGSDLTRSELVAGDVRGDRIGEVVRGGRVDAGMPAFTTLADRDLAAVVAFIHDQKAQAAAAIGGRRSVEVADLQTGNIRAGRRYFEAHCTGCHSAEGDLAGVGAKLEGLPLLRRMLYPGSEGSGAVPEPARPAVIVSTRDGTTVSGLLAYRDEFTIALIDEDGRYRSWSTRRVTYVLDDPREAHVEQLGRYTDQDMHDVLAYLHSLR